MKKFKLKIYSKMILVDILLVVLMSLFVPILSGYPPFSEESSFQIQIEGLTHTQQYILFGVFGIILHLSFIRIFFKDIFKFLKGFDAKKTFSKEFIKKVREQCFTTNKKLVISQLCVLTVLLAALFTNVQISIVLCIKFLLIYFSFMMTSMIIYILLIRDNLNDVIQKTYSQYGELKLNCKKTKFNMNLIGNLLPFFFIVTIICSLLGYSKVCDKLGESSYYYYNLYLNNLDYSKLTLSELKEELNEIPLKDSRDYYMIIPQENRDSIYFSSSEGYVTDFFLLYMDTYSSKTNGRIYEYFGVEEQAYIKNVTLASGENLNIGFKYSNTSVDTIIFFVSVVIISSIAFTSILAFWAKNTSKNIVEVSNSMTEIATNEKIDSVRTLPILSTDEIGELTSSFNKIQKLTTNHIEQIKNGQDTLMERERLASLGQLIGGIAHNLKTPIMSISGASEGLTDLIKEYDSSIDDPQVNSQDHHDIAKDMYEWVKKIKDYSEYMSDVITAVKGQAVIMSEQDSYLFTIDELVKRVDILMRHELKNALINLKTSVTIDGSIEIKGNVNSLVQVINNMISNAIQAYNGRTNENIELAISKENSNVIISIKDYAGGLPKEVSDKLFKEMVTTKGKNGTGLGLFMSYSNIRAHFNGNIIAESKAGVGTEFKIILPV